MSTTDSLKARYAALSNGLNPAPVPTDPYVLTSQLNTKLDKNGDASSTKLVLPNGATRSLLDKSFESKSVTDYYLQTDLGDIAPAIERAVNQFGVKRLNFFQVDSPFTLKRPFQLPNASVILEAESNRQTELKLIGANDYHAIVGNSSAMVYNFYMNNFLFTKQNASTQGAVLKLQNVGYWQFNNNRIYGENKIWRALDLVSTIEGFSDNVRIESILDKAVFGTGGSASPGNVGGPFFDSRFLNWYVYGSGAASADPVNDGCMVADSYFQAIIYHSCIIGQHRGAAFRFAGINAAKGVNVLNFVINPNVESDFTEARIAYMNYIYSSSLGGSRSWVSSSGGSSGVTRAGIELTQNTTNITISGLQIGQAGAGSVGILDNGTRNIIQDNQFVGYDTNADAGIIVGANARKGSYERNTVSQLKRVLVDQSPDNAGHVIKDLTYDSISGQALTGLTGSTSSNKVIKNITNLDAPAPSLIPSSDFILSVPDKGDTFTINATGTINAIVTSYFGRRITLLLATSGITFNDLQYASGTFALYLSPGTFTTDSGRWRITLEWRGDYWWEISRSH
jgi:hypothetical protein